MTPRTALILSCWLALIWPAPAAQRTWDGGGNDGDWRTAQNWDGNIFLPIPIAQGDTLLFPEGPTKLVNTNDFGAGTNFSALTFSGDDYIVRGNMIGLTNGISVTHASGATALHLPITLRDDQSFHVSSSSAFLHLYSEIAIGVNTLTFDGAGSFVLIGEITNGRFGVRTSVVKSGTGRLTIFQPTDHDVPTIVNGGILAVEHRMTNSTVTVNPGGTLRGSSRIGGLNGNGGIIAPGGATPDAIECYGDVSLGAGTVLRLRLNGTTAGVTYDQLEVKGTVTLGGTLEIVPGLLPAVGDRFTVIDNDGTDDIVGTFDGLPDGAIFTVNGRPYQIDYGRRDFFRHNDVVVEAVPALAVWDGGGDLNRRWSQPLNWVGDIVPYPGDDLYFPNPVTTTNDFPASRLFGSITFGGGTHRVDGNPAVFDGSLAINSSCDIEIYMPMTLGGGFRLTHSGDLWFGAPLTLSRSQTFAIEHTNLIVYIHQGIDIGPYNLTLENQTWDRPGYPTHASFYLYEQISGTGRLIKNGPGQCRFIQCPILCSELIVNEGEITESPVIGGAVTINNGGALGFVGNVTGPINVTPGGLLQDGRFLTNVTVNGGTFAPGFTTFISDGLRMVSNATYQVRILRDFSGDLTLTVAGVLGGVTLSNTTLRVVQADAGTLPHGSSYAILNPDPATTSTFQGLAEGARLVVGQNALTLSYQGGELFTLTTGLPFVWDGGGSDSHWTTPANWVGDVAPLPSHGLTFPVSATRRANTNDFPAQTAFKSLVFDGTLYFLRGNSLLLTNGVYHNPSGQNIVELGLRFAPSPSTNPQPIFVASSGFLRMENTISNCFVEKTGPGILRLGGIPNNPQFSLRVLEGNVELVKPPLTAAISQTLEVGDGTSMPVVRYLNGDQLTDTTDVVVRRPARLDLDGNTDTIDTLSGDGTLSLGASSARLTVLGFGTFNGNITGTGGLTRAGVSFQPLILAGTNTFSGTTIVESSNLQIDGLHTNSTILLNGGLLGGRGRVGNIQGSLGGTLAPGRIPASFQNFLYTRNVQLNGNITFRPDILSLSPDFENTRLQVTGTVDLGGSVLQARCFTTPPTNTSFVVIDNDGADPIIGTFNGLPEGTTTAASGQPFRITYAGGTGNDVVLTRVNVPPSTFTGIELYGSNEVRLQGSGVSGVRYTLERTFSLDPPIVWFYVGPTTASNGVWTSVQSIGATQQFYRAVFP